MYRVSICIRSMCSNRNNRGKDAKSRTTKSTPSKENTQPTVETLLQYIYVTKQPTFKL